MGFVAWFLKSLFKLVIAVSLGLTALFLLLGRTVGR